MSLIGSLLKKLFGNPVIVQSKPLITIKDLSILDDVWIKEDDEIYKGWVWEISRRCITVVYGEDLRDFKFQMLKPLSRMYIEQDNKILYCNKPE